MTSKLFRYVYRRMALEPDFFGTGDSWNQRTQVQNQSTRSFGVEGDVFLIP